VASGGEQCAIVSPHYRILAEGFALLTAGYSTLLKSSSGRVTRYYYWVLSLLKSSSNYLPLRYSSLLRLLLLIAAFVIFWLTYLPLR
jgi:hypothetical protein